MVHQDISSEKKNTVEKSPYNDDFLENRKDFAANKLIKNFVLFLPFF